MPSILHLNFGNFCKEDSEYLHAFMTIHDMMQVIRMLQGGHYIRVNY